MYVCYKGEAMEGEHFKGIILNFANKLAFRRFSFGTISAEGLSGFTLHGCPIRLLSNNVSVFAINFTEPERRAPKSILLELQKRYWFSHIETRKYQGVNIICVAALNLIFECE